MKFYQRLEWQLAIAIVILVGITITYTGLLQPTSVNILLSEVPPENTVENEQYHHFIREAFPEATEQEPASNPDFNTLSVTTSQQFQQRFGDSNNLLVITDTDLNPLAVSQTAFIFVELIRQEPDKSGYSIVISSLYGKRELFQLYQSVPGMALGDKGFAFVFPDPTDTSQPDTFELIKTNLYKHFKGLGIYYLAIALFIIVFVRLRLAPLRRLEAFSRQLSSEKLPSPMAPSAINDELSLLIKAFNEALTRLSDEKQRRTALLADMAHELRTPLHNLKGRLELEAEGITAINEQSSAYSLKQINQLVQLVNDIDLLNSMDERALLLNKTPTDIQKFITDALDVISHPNKFHWELTGDNAEVHIDCVRMIQVFENLLHNALKANPNNLVIHVDINKYTDVLEIRLWDNGPGVPESELDLLFKRLYRVDKSRHDTTGGSGLGLSIVKKIIELHDGTIECYLSEGGGLGMLIRLTL